MEFKDKVYQARMQLNLTQMEFAKELGFGFATISRWENGVTRPTKLKILLILIIDSGKIIIILLKNLMSFMAKFPNGKIDF